MDLSKLLTKVKENLKKIPEAFYALLSSKKPVYKAPREKSHRGGQPAGAASAKKPMQDLLFSLEDRFLYRYPENKRRPILLGLGVMVLLFIILLISIPVTLLGRQEQTVAAGISGGFFIPAEELFFPAEPDFLPEFIFEREPRGHWQLEDLGPFWRSPENTELWKEQVKLAVDSIMEGVP